MSNTRQATPAAEQEKVGIGAYISLLCAVIFFSGICSTKEWWGIFDFTTLLGGWGKMLTSVSLDEAGQLVTAASNFRGAGGSGAIDGFMFGVTLVPAVMLAMGMITIFDHYGALRAARNLLTPILRPLMGLNGTCSLALITSLQSTDGGAALTRQLLDANEISYKEAVVFSTFQMTAGATITNFLSSGAALFSLTEPSGEPSLTVSLGLCLGVILLLKLVSANAMRLLLIRMDK